MCHRASLIEWLHFSGKIFVAFLETEYKKCLLLVHKIAKYDRIHCNSELECNKGLLHLYDTLKKFYVNIFLAITCTILEFKSFLKVRI